MAGDIWFLSDPHFYHNFMVKACGRPGNFTDLIIDKTNEKVNKSDRLYILGDFAYWKRGVKLVREARERINCQDIVLIYGNHDNIIRNSQELQRMFTSTHDLLELQVGGRYLVMCHYPMITWNRKRYGSYMLHGHEHFSLGNITDRFMLDVGVDNPLCNYGPIDMDTVNEEMTKKTNVPVGHH